MTSLTFAEPIELEKLTGVLNKLDVVTPGTSLCVALKDNHLVTEIVIYPAVPADKTEDMTKLAEEIGVTLKM